MALDTVAQIKERLAIQDVLAPYMKLTRAGKSLVGLCPFHKEKTPSFHVSPERGTWHCFGCGLGGDGFSFIEKVEGVDFKGALKILAEKAGVEIEYDTASRENRSRTERLREAMNRASEWYATRFLESPAHAYAKQRNLSNDTMRTWRLGYAPDSWRELLEALTAKGFSTEELLSAGLIKEADGKRGTYYDRFRNRLIFPIRDVAGRVVAFTGRSLVADETAKYLNSPETDLYHKSEILFGIDVAKDAIRTRGFAMLVEGQMDVLHAHQAGFQNAIALSGTTLSERHLNLLKRYSDNLMLILDADQAGFHATAKSAALALTAGLRVKAARLPEGKDPADIISEDAKDFSRRIKDAKPIVEFFLAELAEKESDSHRLLRAAEKIVLPIIAAIPSPMEREYFMQSAGRVLSLSTEAIRESLQRSTKENSVSSPESISGNTPSSQRSVRDRREEQLLAVMHAYAETPLANRVKLEYSRITEAQSIPQIELPESALFDAEQTFGEGPSEDAADELLHAFEEAVIREAYQKSVTYLRRAEASGDASVISSAQEECSKLSARLASFGE